MDPLWIWAVTVEEPVILHSWVATAAAIASAAINVAGGILNNQAKDSEYERQIANYGIEHAAIDAQAAYDQIGLDAEARSVQENKQRTELQIEQNAMAAQAQAEVSAAASGTAGNSVDVTQAQIDQNAGAALGNIARMEQAQLNQIDQTSRDINISAASGKRIPDPQDNRGGLVELFGAGLQGFLMGR